MVAIKGLEKPIECKKCRLMGIDGDPRDILNPKMCVAIWATSHETKRCVGGKILDDCPLVEIKERKMGKWLFTKTIFDKYGSTVECQSCHKKWKTYDEIRWKKENKFCPNCGAEMEGEE